MHRALTAHFKIFRGASAFLVIPSKLVVLPSPGFSGIPFSAFRASRYENEMPKRARPVSTSPPASPVTPAKPAAARRVAPMAIVFGECQDVHEALACMSQADPVLGGIIDEIGVLPRIAECQDARKRLNEPHCAFRSLAKAIVFQQLHGAAAATIFARVQKLVGASEDATKLTPESFYDADETELRACGLSRRKMEYLKGLAAAFSESDKDGQGPVLSDAYLESGADDDEAIRIKLLNLKGIGAWTVDMFFMFYLNRADVLPVGDFGVRKGMMVAYGLKAMPSPTQMETVAKKWSPHRTLGSFYMWHVADAEKEKKKSVLKGKKG